MAIKAIYASVQDIGKTVKKTKKHYVWKFSIDGRDHILELFTSMISGKKKIMIDGRIIFEGQKVLSSHFSYPVDVDRHTVNIYQHGEKYDVLINGQPFTQFYAGQGRDGGYDDVSSSNHHSYGFSKSVTSKVGDKYNKDKRLRNNNERDEYATRAKYDGNKYYTNDEKIDSWNDVDNKVSNTRRRDHHNNGYSDRSDSIEREDYTDFSRPITKSKTFGATNDFQESENRPRHAHQHHSKSQMNRPSSHFENQGSFNDFSNFGKENQPVHDRTQQKGFTQPPVSSKPSTNTQIKADFFNLDTADQRTEQPKTQVQTANHQDFFNFGNTTTTTVQQKEEPKTNHPTLQKQNSMPAPVTTNDLIDFGGPTLASLTDLYKQSPQTNQTIEFPVQQNNNVQSTTTQSKPEPEKPKSDSAKKDLWNSDLVSLGDIGNKPNKDTSNKQPEFINFQIPQSGTASLNTSSSMNNNMNNMNNMNMMNTNMGNMGMMNNMGNMGMMNSGFGQPNMMQGMGFNTNMGMGMGMNMNMGGYGNMGMNPGMGGFGGMYNGFPSTNYY